MVVTTRTLVFRARSADQLSSPCGVSEDTLQNRSHDALPHAIALLRLDTDFYESTKTELVC